MENLPEQRSFCFLIDSRTEAATPKNASFRLAGPRDGVLGVYYLVFPARAGSLIPSILHKYGKLSRRRPKSEAA